MALITDVDLSAFLGQPSLSGDPRAQMVAALASGLITDYLQNPAVGVVTTYTDIVLDGPARLSPVFLLPGFPITDVSKVEEWSGTAWVLQDPASYAWNSAGYVSRSKRADARYGICYWTPLMRGLRVSYSAGFATVPESLRAVALAIAARGLSNPLGVLSERIGDYQVQYGQTHSSWIELDMAEMAVITAYANWSVG